MRFLVTPQGLTEVQKYSFNINWLNGHFSD